MTSFVGGRPEETAGAGRGTEKNSGQKYTWRPSLRRRQASADRHDLPAVPRLPALRGTAAQPRPPGLFLTRVLFRPAAPAGRLVRPIDTALTVEESHYVVQAEGGKRMTAEAMLFMKWLNDQVAALAAADERRNNAAGASAIGL